MKIYIKFKQFIKRYPKLKLFLGKTRFILWEKKVSYISRLRPVKINPYKILWVDPNRIKNSLVYKEEQGEYIKQHEIGKIVGGNWDLNTMPFDELNIFKAFRKRFIDGARWQDTSYYKCAVEQLDMGRKQWGVSNKEELDNKLSSLELLFEEIKKNGYKTQSELQAFKYSSQALDEITVRIGRDGEFFFEDGRHRLSIAKILGLKKIPVIVTWRHRTWCEFRAQILDYANKNSGKVYQPIMHPDLSDIPSAHGHSRFEIIKPYLPAKRGTVLDIGANWGYFCHRLEDEGFQCYAVESIQQTFYFLNKLKIAENKKFIAIHLDIFEIFDKTDFDIVLAFNVFHHFLKTEEQFKKLIKFLKRLKIKIMFFEPHLPGELQMKRAHCNFTPEEFVMFIAENTDLKQWKLIGREEEGRPIYMLTKENNY